MPSTGIELGVKNFWIAGSMFFATGQYRTEKLLSMQGCLEGAKGAVTAPQSNYLYLART